MINSINALEFLKPKSLIMDKYNSTTTTKLLPPSLLTPTRPFVTTSGQQKNAIDSLQETQPQRLLNNEVRDHERVKVQHLESHTKLQNNKCWNNFRTLYNISASADVGDRAKDEHEIDVVNNEHLTSTTTRTPFNIRYKSAFNLDVNKKYPNSIGGNNNFNNPNPVDSLKFIETNNNNNNKFYCKRYNNYGLINKQSATKIVTVMSQPTLPTTVSQRTADQNHAYRHIESVHNYAKSKLFEGDDDENTSTNGSHHSSYLDDDEDDDDDDEDNAEDNEEYGNDDELDYDNRLESTVDEMPDDLDVDYEDILIKRKCRRFQKLPASSNGAHSTQTDNVMGSRRGYIVELQKSANFLNILKETKAQNTKMHKKKISDTNEEEEVQIDVDVETVESQSLSTAVLDTNCLMEIGACVKPDHHARRPMNAFLIFCKRHRAIVKERYKNLENRAITKILGDWWASLDSNDKNCFVNLAQQNKDAFFSANPNFKWYKLPAPPLRTLTTRPTNTFGQDYQEESATSAVDVIKHNTRCNNNHSNYFKLADEAQMGDLSHLMQDHSNTTKQCIDLQQALGETSQFMSAHITSNSEALEENHLKRRFCNENSFSSNSSEDDVIEPKKKSVRSCKGKRYQELINSGQIATAVKKSKCLTRSTGGGDFDNSETNIKQTSANVTNIFHNLSNNGCQKRLISESENVVSYELNGFDLEERIKELPALNLDDYLQRKRNTKKKKKFSSNGKKKMQRNNTNSKKFNESAATLSNDQLQQQHQMLKHQQQVATAVGSQKRKARKESITRRDVSAIEEEVASLLPLTINGCCYFQEAPTGTKYKKTIENDPEDIAAIPPQSLNVTSATPIIPSKLSSSSSVSSEILNISNTSNNVSNDNITSSTSDLLILAEVAANRTELKH